MWQKERDTRNAALKTNIALLDEENRDWLIMQLLGVQGFIRQLDITAADNRLQEIIEAVAEEE
jgi:hypothetical protein